MDFPDSELLSVSDWTWESPSISGRENHHQFLCVKITINSWTWESPSIPGCENHHRFPEVKITRIKLWPVFCPEKRSREFHQVTGSGFPTHEQGLNPDNRNQLSVLNYTISAAGTVDVLSGSGTSDAVPFYYFWPGLEIYRGGVYNSPCKYP